MTRRLCYTANVLGSCTNQTESFPMKPFSAGRRTLLILTVAALFAIVIIQPACRAAESAAGVTPLKWNTFLDDWIVVGPIPLDRGTNGTDLAAQEKEFQIDALAGCGGESSVRPRAGAEVRLGDLRLQWKTARTHSDVLDLGAALGQKAGVAAYAYKEFRISGKTRALLALGSDDAAAVWLNGKRVFSRWVQRAVKRDEDLVPIELERGTNRLLMKVQNGSGPWGLACRIVNLHGLTQPLAEAAFNGNRDAVLRCLTNGADVNAKAGPGLTAWQAARIRGHDSLANLLVERGSRTNVAWPKPDGIVTWMVTNQVRPSDPGLALAIIRNGKLEFKGGWGCACLDYQIPVRADTIFHVASVSKQFTAYAAALLEQQGKLSLDDGIGKYLTNAPETGKTITIRHLLNHTSGLRDQWELLMMAGWRLDDVITQEDILNILSRQRELNFAPGEEHLYCNSGYTLVSEIVSRVSGQSFCDFTREQIFEPLCMTRTHFHLDHQEVVPNMAYSYEPGGNGHFQKSVLSYANVGATSLFTTVEDLARWLANFEHPLPGTAPAVARLQEKGRLNNGKEIGYAAGLSIGDYRKARTVSHGGADAGYRSFVVWFPDQHLGVALLSNLGSMDVAGLSFAAADIFLRDQLGTADRPEAKPPSPVGAPAFVVDPANLGLYPGKYIYEGNLLAVVTRQEAALKFELMGQSEILKPSALHEFTAGPGNAKLTFEGLQDGKAGQVTLQVPGQKLTFKRVTADAGPAPALTDYEGDYWSPELGVFYSVSVKEGQLVLRARRHGEFVLHPITKDQFSASALGMPIGVKFQREGSGRVNGFGLTGERVRNLRFNRQESPQRPLSAPAVTAAVEPAR